MMTPIVTGDVSGVFALLQLIADPEASRTRLRELKEAQDKLAGEAESARQDRVDAEKAQKGSEAILAEVNRKHAELDAREKILASQTALAAQVLAKAREDAAAILLQAKAESGSIREATEAFIAADFDRTSAVSAALRELKNQVKEAELRLANANAALDALRAKVTA